MNFSVGVTTGWDVAGAEVVETPGTLNCGGSCGGSGGGCRGCGGGGGCGGCRGSSGMTAGAIFGN